MFAQDNYSAVWACRAGVHASLVREVVANFHFCARARWHTTDHKTASRLRLFVRASGVVEFITSEFEGGHLSVPLRGYRGTAAYLDRRRSLKFQGIFSERGGRGRGGERGKTMGGKQWGGDTRYTRPAIRWHTGTFLSSSFSRCVIGVRLHLHTFRNPFIPRIIHGGIKSWRAAEVFFSSSLFPSSLPPYRRKAVDLHAPINPFNPSATSSACSTPKSIACRRHAHAPRDRREGSRPRPKPERFVQASVYPCRPEPGPAGSLVCHHRCAPPQDVDGVSAVCAGGSAGVGP